MKNFIKFLLIVIILLDIVDHNLFNDDLFDYIKNKKIKFNYNVIFNEDSLNQNEYIYKEFTSNVKLTNDFNPKNKEELMNVYYTALNNGLDEFSFCCPLEYKECIKDVGDLSKESEKFSYINQLVHPYNSFMTIKSTYSASANRRVDISITKKYSDDDINKIENKIDEIINTLNINNYSNINDKIKVFHDYLVNNNKYDSNKEKNFSSYHSDTAIGPLFEGYAICSGYSDAMAIFLNKLNLENTKVVTKDHVWNVVKINDKWYHLDVTWDDPVTNTGENVLRYDYFLINTDNLLKKDLTQHNFDKNLFEFLK